MCPACGLPGAVDHGAPTGEGAGQDGAGERPQREPIAAEAPIASPQLAAPRRLGSSTMVSFSSTKAELPKTRVGLGGVSLGRTPELGARSSSSVCEGAEDDGIPTLGNAGFPIAPNGDGLTWVDARRIGLTGPFGPGETPMGVMPLVRGFEGDRTGMESPGGSAAGALGDCRGTTPLGGGDIIGDGESNGNGGTEPIIGPLSTALIPVELAICGNCESGLNGPGVCPGTPLWRYGTRGDKADGEVIGLNMPIGAGPMFGGSCIFNGNGGCGA